MRAMKCKHNFKYLVRFNILDHFFFERGYSQAVVVGIMQLVVRWKGEVFGASFEGGTKTLIKALNVTLSEVKEHVQPS